MATTGPLLRVSGVRVVYDGVIGVLKGISLEVPDGGMVAILGANGAGKTTLVKAISGVLPAEGGAITEGTIELAGQRLDGQDPSAVVRLGVTQVMEGRRLFEQLTVEENLRAGAYLRGDRAAIRADLERVYGYFPVLRERRRLKAGYLSGGEQQMLAIGRGLMARPRLMLLDEPSLGLAPLLVREVFEIIRRLNREEGVSILVAEQNARVALNLVSYGYVMEGGRIALEGPSSRLRVDRAVQEFYLGYGRRGSGPASAMVTASG
jgi:branched-chain amino acid transport system ATP-binding protein